ncbi:MAG: hypothetical protein MPJ22_09020 [Pirellulales bacterium]|nr:hypothetical protein [Pirellulales bacterium]
MIHLDNTTVDLPGVPLAAEMPHLAAQLPAGIRIPALAVLQNALARRVPHPFRGVVGCPDVVVVENMPPAPAEEQYGLLTVDILSLRRGKPVTLVPDQPVLELHAVLRQKAQDMSGVERRVKDVNARGVLQFGDQQADPGKGEFQKLLLAPETVPVRDF